MFIIIIKNLFLFYFFDNFPTSALDSLDAAILSNGKTISMKYVIKVLCSDQPHICSLLPADDKHC